MFKKLFFFTAAILIATLFSFSFLLAQEKQSTAISKQEGVALSEPQNKEISKADPGVNYEVPEWIKRTNIAIEAGSDIKPKYFFETIQPLLGTTPDGNFVFFNQSRVSARDYRTTYNTGFGLRKIFREKYLLGVNTFYDYQDLHQHHRSGVGFEFITDRGIEARTNTYIRVSNKRLVRDDGANEYFESVANGVDWEFGSPLPYLPFLKLYGGGNWYNYQHFKNRYGWQMRLEYTPLKHSRIDFIVLNDNKRNKTAYRFEGALTLAFTSFALRDILSDIKGSKELFPKINLSDKMLERVVRDFDITVITSTKAKGGLVVEGGKRS